jgi:hypothetical protein
MTVPFVAVTSPPRLRVLSSRRLYNWSACGIACGVAPRSSTAALPIEINPSKPTCCLPILRAVCTTSGSTSPKAFTSAAVCAGFHTPCKTVYGPASHQPSPVGFHPQLFRRIAVYSVAFDGKALVFTEKRAIGSGAMAVARTMGALCFRSGSWR